MPTSKADIDPNFEKRVRDLAAHAAASHRAVSSSGQRRWFRPAGASGDGSDLAGLTAPFSRDAANGHYMAAVSDAADPGTTGDVVASTTQIDLLANMERAYVSRRLRGPRAAAHAAGRRAGHGSEQGPLYVNMLEYVRNVLKQAKAGG